MHQHQLSLVTGALDWMNGAQGGAVDFLQKSHHGSAPPSTEDDGTETSPSEASVMSSLSWISVGLSSLCLLVGVALSIRLSLGLHTQLLVSALRAVLQLTFLGVVLVPLFTYSRWWMVLLYSIFMTCVAALEAGQRPAYSYQGQYLHTLMSLAMGAWTLIVYTVVGVVRPQPMWDAQYVIPILGMLLGNATSGVAVGLNTALQDLASSKEYIELLLSLGANRAEATKTVVQKALTNAMMPTINMMAVMGLVSIPGMMTGQILAGADPSDASRYQMMIVFLISGSAGIATTAAVHMAVWHIVDEGAHYRPDRLLPRRRAMDTWKEAGRRVIMALSRTKALCLTCLCCVTPTSFHKRPHPSRYEMMYSLDDEILDEEEGLTGRGGNTSHHVLVPYSSPPRPAPNGTYRHAGPSMVGSPGSDASAAASTIASPGSLQQGAAGLGGSAHVNGMGSTSPGPWSPGADNNWGGGGGSGGGHVMAVPSYGGSGGPVPAKGGIPAPQGQAIPHQMQAPAPMVLGADVPPSQQAPQTRSRRLYNFGVRIAHAAMDRIGNTSSGRGGPQYVPLSTGTGTNSVYELGEEGSSTRGGTAGSGQQPQSNTTGLGSHQQGAVEGARGSPESDQGGARWQAPRQAQSENEWGEGGLVSPRSGASTPVDDGIGSPDSPPGEFYDAQSVGGSQMGSRRTSFSSLRGLGSRGMPPGDPQQQAQTQQPPASSGRSTPPRT